MNEYHCGLDRVEQSPLVRMNCKICSTTRDYQIGPSQLSQGRDLIAARCSRFRPITDSNTNTHTRVVPIRDLVRRITLKLTIRAIKLTTCNPNDPSLWLAIAIHLRCKHLLDLGLMLPRKEGSSLGTAISKRHRTNLSQNTRLLLAR